MHSTIRVSSSRSYIFFYQQSDESYRLFYQVCRLDDDKITPVSRPTRHKISEPSIYTEMQPASRLIRIAKNRPAFLNFRSDGRLQSTVTNFKEIAYTVLNSSPFALKPATIPLHHGDHLKTLKKKLPVSE